MAITGRTATVVENAAASSITGSLPSDRQTGDFVVAIFGFTTTNAITGPAGWTQLIAPTVINGGAGPETLAAYYRFTPPAAPTASYTGTADNCSVICQAYGNVNPTTPIDVTPVISQAASTSLVETGVTIATAGARMLSTYITNTTSRATVTPAGMTLVKTYSASSSGRCLALADEVRASTGATGTRTWTLSPSATLEMAGFITALRPQTGVSFTGSVSASGALNKTTVKRFLASITAAGAFSKIKVVFRVFDGSTAPTGELIRKWKKIFIGSVVASGTLQKLLSRTFLASITATGFLRKAFVRKFTGAITATGNVVITFLGRTLGRPGRAALSILKAGEALVRVRRK